MEAADTEGNLSSAFTTGTTYWSPVTNLLPSTMIIPGYALLAALASSDMISNQHLDSPRWSTSLLVLTEIL